MPEHKTVKNALHLDVAASGGRAVPRPTRVQRVDAVAARLVEHGARIVGVHASDGLDHYAVALIDPEGNEFDVN